ncbi:hypothetical protein HAX54_035563, partial [Datura stramonium]|nr:hypothetical protein [Datura stramonium]
DAFEALKQAYSTIFRLIVVVASNKANVEWLLVCRNAFRATMVSVILFAIEVLAIVATYDAMVDSLK